MCSRTGTRPSSGCARKFPVHTSHIALSAAKFRLRPEVSLAYNDGFDARRLNRIQKLVERNREQIEDAWHEYFT